MHARKRSATPEGGRLATEGGPELGGAVVPFDGWSERQQQQAASGLREGVSVSIPEHNALVKSGHRHGLGGRHGVGLRPQLKRLWGQHGHRLAHGHAHARSWSAGSQGSLSELDGLELELELERSCRSDMPVKSPARGFGEGSKVDCTSRAGPRTVESDRSFFPLPSSGAAVKEDEEVGNRDLHQTRAMGGMASATAEGLTRVKTIWRDAQRSWRLKRRAAASGTCDDTVAAIRDVPGGYAASTGLALLQCGEVRSQSHRGSRENLPATSSSSFPTRTSPTRTPASGVLNHSDFGHSPSPSRPGKKEGPGFVDLRSLPPVMLRSPSQAGAVTNRRRPLPHHLNSRRRHSDIGGEEQPIPDANLRARRWPDLVLPVILWTAVWMFEHVRAQRVALRQFRAVFDPSANRASRVQSFFALSRFLAVGTLVLYLMALFAGTAKTLLDWLGRLFWPLNLVFRVLRWLLRP